MKITIVLGAFLPVPPVMGGAVEKIWFALGQEFARRGHEVFQISRAVPNFPKDETIAGVKHLRVSGFNTPRSLPWLKVLDGIYSLRILSMLPTADVVVTNTFWLPFFLRNSRRGKLYVHIARFPKGQMRMYRHAARLQTPSAVVAEAVTAEVPQCRSKVTVIPYPAPEPATGNLPTPMAQREKWILYVGRIHPEKGVHLLVEAFVARARDLLGDWKLMIIGPSENHLGGGGAGYLEQLHSIANADADHITFAGSVFDAAALARQFQAARLFVYPSLAETGESFGLAPLEAMTHGCAVLVSNLRCFQDFVRDGESGFVFDHREPDPVSNLRSKIDSLCVDENLMARVAENGMRKTSEYSVERIADKFLDDFDAVMRE